MVSERLTGLDHETTRWASRTVGGFIQEASSLLFAAAAGVVTPLNPIRESNKIRITTCKLNPQVNWPADHLLPEIWARGVLHPDQRCRSSRRLMDRPRPLRLPAQGRRPLLLAIHGRAGSRGPKTAPTWPQKRRRGSSAARTLRARPHRSCPCGSWAVSRRSTPPLWHRPCRIPLERSQSQLHGPYLAHFAANHMGSDNEPLSLSQTAKGRSVRHRNLSPLSNPLLSPCR